MTNSKNTRRALLGAVLSLIICVSMLVGTTFAWFTDTASTAVNSVQSGTLDIELQYQKADGSWANAEGITLSFKKAANAPAYEQILWEPGCTYELPAVKVVNKGNLAVKYEIAISGIDGDAKLNEVIDWTYNGETTLNAEGTLLADKESDPIVIKGHMQETAGNEYQNLTIDGIAITVYATQLAHEYDSFGNEYDAGLTPIEDGDVLVEEDDIQYLYTSEGNYVLYLVTENYTKDTVVIPEGVDAIGNYAFAYNSNVKEVILSSTVKSLGRGFDSSTVEKVVLNEGLEQIDSRAFRATTALKEIVISSTVKTIADNAFQKSAIKNIVIPSTVETVGETAFGSSLIETVTFEGNTSIQGYAFRGCAKLRTVYLKGDDVTFISSTLNGRNSTWFCNGESNNPGTSNITFYVENETVAARVRTALGAEKPETTPIYVGESLFASVKNATEFQNALNNATQDTIINFTADITGNATVTQKDNIDIIINGNEKKFNGVMTTFGNGRQSGSETLTIKNINFVAAGGADSCIVSPDRSKNNKYSYSHNVTVLNCTFTDTDGTVNCAAVRHEDGGDKNWTVKDCTVDNTMHSLLQVNNVAGKLTVEGCTVNSKNGINLNSCTKVDIIDCDIDVKGYAVRYGVNSGGNLNEAKSFSIKDSTLKSANDDGDAVIIFRADAVKAVLTLENTTLIGTPDIDGATADTTINR